jgi:hypothetical protein
LFISVYLYIWSYHLPFHLFKCQSTCLSVRPSVRFDMFYICKFVVFIVYNLNLLNCKCKYCNPGKCRPLTSSFNFCSSFHSFILRRAFWPLGPPL